MSIAPAADWHDALYLPRTELPPAGEPVELAGVEVCVLVQDTDPSSAPAQWMADREIALIVSDELTPAKLARVLPAFLTHAAALADRPTVASLALPSRDVDRGRVARLAGLTASSVLAVADLRRGAGPAGPHSAIRVRDATPADVDAVAQLWCEQAEYEARIGTLRTSPAILSAIAAGVPGHVTGDDTVLVAERDEQLVGAIVAESPTTSAWSGSRLVLTPISYLAMASTAPGARGGGVGAALVAELHRRHRAAKLAASTLHYSADNPLSVPFWSRQGYRPLLTHFAAVIR